jgi:8-oxo-dGTP diphosphatase
VNVVAAAIVRGGFVLAARRNRPADLAGGWEFPGGKVEPGEDESAALVRECHEELGVDVAVGPRVGVARDQAIRLALYAASLDAGEPMSGEDHDELRWLRPDQFGDVRWLPIDAELLAAVAAHLRRNS